MIQKYSWLLFTLLVIKFQSYGQNVDFSPRNFSGRLPELQLALEEIEKGDSLFFKNKEGSDVEALQHYMIAQKINQDNAFLNYKIGACYLNSVFKDQALPYLRKAKNYDIGVNPDLFYLLAQAYHHSEKFDSAFSCYKIFETRFFKDFTSGMLPAEIKNFREELDLNISYSQNARELYLTPIPVDIQNIGPVINTSDPEYNPKISADNNELVFTSRRSNTIGGGKHKLDDKYYEDIYISYKKHGNWTSPVNLGRPVNTELNDGIISLSVDGQRILSDYGGISGDIYESKLYGSRWSRPEKMPKVINSDEIESSACWTADGTGIYFTSDRAGGFGGGDIYYVKVNPDGSLGHPENLGSAVNTKYNEESVFIHPDGKTLYFSSEGHNSIGGYDVFKSTFLGGQWSEPVNLGYPVNTVDDDVFFTITADGNTAFYSSERKAGYGGQDIYMITFNKTNDKVTEPMAMQLLSGRVLDAVLLQPIGAQIEVYDNTSRKITFITNSNSTTGKFSFSLPSGKKYGLNFNVPGYLFHSINLDLSMLNNYEGSLKNVFLYKISNKTCPERELQKALIGNCFELLTDEDAKLEIDPANGKITKGKEFIVQRNVEKILLKNRDRLVLLFDAGIDMEDVIELLCQEIINNVSDDSIHKAVPSKTELSGLVEIEMKAFRKSNELDLFNTTSKPEFAPVKGTKNGAFIINLMQISRDAINDTTGEIETPPELEQGIHQNFLNIVLDNKHIINDLLKQKKNPVELKQHLCYEICTSGGVKFSGKKPPTSASVASYVHEALSMVYPSIYHKQVFSMALPSSFSSSFLISSKKLLKENEKELKAILNKIITENSKQFELLFTSGKCLQDVQESFYIDLLENLNPKNEAISPGNLFILKKLSSHAVENIFLDLNMIHVIKDTKITEENLPFQSYKIKQLISDGLSYKLITRMLTRGYLMSANLNDVQVLDDQEVQKQSEQTKVILEDHISSIIPDRNIFKVNLFETTREAISDADGSFTEKNKNYIEPDIDKILDDNRILISALISVGKTTVQIENLLAEEIARKSGAVDDLNNGIISEELKKLIHERILLKISTKQDHLFNISQTSLFKTSLNNYLKGGSLDSFAILNEFKQLCLINSDIISALLKTGIPINHIRQKFLDEIILNAGIILKPDTRLQNFTEIAFTQYLNDVLIIPPIYEARIVLNNIFFEYDRIELKGESENELGKLLDLLVQNPNIRIEISGHSDNIGSDEYNMELSLRRARSVESYLITKGVSAGRLVAKGYGKSRPIAPNNLSGGIDNPEGRAMNRRTEFTIITEK